MVVQLFLLTEKMIASFNECTRKGDYKPFVKENEHFIRMLSKDLKKVRFDKDDIISFMVSGILPFYLNYLTQYDPRNAFCVVRGVKLLERHTPTLTDSLKSSIAAKDWSKFYSEYRPTADFVIKEARNQSIFDFQIEYGSSSYDTFEDRDFVAQSQNQIQYLPPIPQAEPADLRNDKEMIRCVGEDADNQSFHTNYPQHVQHRPPIHQAEPIDLKNNEEPIQLVQKEEEKLSVGELLQNIHISKLEKDLDKGQSRNPCLSEIEDLQNTVQAEVANLKTFVQNSLEEHSQQTNEKLGKFNNALKLENDDSRSNMEKTLEEMIRKVVREEVAKEISKTINARKDVKDVQSQTEVELAVFEPPTTDSGVSRSASYESPHVSTLSLESLDLNQQIAVETIDEIPDQQEVPSGLDSSELPVIIEDSSLNDNFSQRLAEQNRFYEEKLRAMREKRVVKNKAAEEELRELGNRITRGASWRSSWHL